MLNAASAAALAALLLAAPAAVQAQSVAAPPVEVRIGAALQAKAEDYGPRELDLLRDDLTRAVSARAARGGWSRLDLVLEDALPNRPTFAMQGRNVSLSLTSIGIGGAKVTGTAYGPDGPRPIRFSWYETDLRNEIGAGIWTDAERAFESLGGQLGRGRVPDRFQPGEPSSRPAASVKSAWRR